MANIVRLISRRVVLRLASAMPVAAAFSAAVPVAGQAASTPLKIGMIGAGREGGALGTAFAKMGHPVMFSSRHPEELKDLVSAAGSNAHAGTVQEAAAFGDVVVLVVPYRSMPDVAKDIGKVLATKPLLLDVSNPIPQRDGDEATKALEEGPGEYLMRLMPGVRIVRAFNTIGPASFMNPTLPSGEKEGVAMAGDDPKAIEIATALARELGFVPVMVGPLSVGKYLFRPSTYFMGHQSAAEIRQAATQLPKK